jgi:hypothetical protein
MTPPDHPFARIVSIRFRPETIDLAMDRFRDSSTPLVRAQTGSLGIIGAVDRGSGRAYAISFWRTREDLEQSNANPRVVDAMTGYAEWMAGPFAVESFAVVCGALPDHVPGSVEYARMTSLVATPESREESLAVLQRRLVSTEDASPECTGILLMTQMVGQRIITFELWSSSEALETSDPDALLEERRLVRDGVLPVPITHELLQVMGRF